jgi:outer membrane lipoprotein-sorting protein
MKGKDTLGVLLIAFLLVGPTVGFGCKKQAPEQPPAGEATTETQAAPQPAAAAPAEPAQPAPSAAMPGGAQSYRYVLEVSGPDQPKTRFEYLISPPKMKMKLISDQGGTMIATMNMVSDGQNMFIVSDDAKTAMKFPAGPEFKPAIPANMVFAPYWDEFQRQHEGYGVENQGTVKLNGEEMTKYQVGAPGSQEKMVMYVNKDNQVRRIELSAPGKTQPTIMDVIELQLNPPVSDADFQPPAGYAIQEMPMMKGLPGMPGAPGAPAQPGQQP